MINEAILFTRSWCIFELLQGHLGGSAMSVQVAGGHPTDHLFKLDQAIEQFTSVQAAQASKDTDKRSIDQLVTEAFGRIEDADELVRTLLLTYQRELRGRYAQQDRRDVADQR
jgi:hypothetical protein